MKNNHALYELVTFLLAKFLECVIIKLESNVTLTTTHVTNHIRPNKQWFQFMKHLYDILTWGSLS